MINNMEKEKENVDIFVEVGLYYFFYQNKNN